jgi:nucleotide-binding universal stress UspA family protein
MKILCPVDFSEASLNAFRYAIKLGDFLGASVVEATHCHYETPRRKVGDPGENEKLVHAKLLELEQTYQSQHSTKIKSSVFQGHPLDVLSPYIKAMGHELVVVGTRGLTQLRDLTIGSFTEDLIFSLDIPILVIPLDCKFDGLTNIVFAIDSEPIADSTTVQLLISLGTRAEASLHVVHVQKDQGTAVDRLNGIERLLDQVTYNFYAVPVEESVTKTLDLFCERDQADLLCMVHRDRGWMINIFHKSNVKEELFHLKIPLLVLSE